METWVAILLPFALVFARTTAMLLAFPLFSSASMPQPLKVGLATLMTIFFATNLPAPELAATQVAMFGALVLLVREVLCGLALGLAARLIFLAIQQGGILIGREMGFYTASIVDPSTDQESEPFGIYLETVFILLFLATGGHHLLIRLIGRSFQAMPIGGEIDFGVLAAGVLAAGGAMLLFALKLAAPILAALLVLAVVLGVLGRVLPEMDILMTSLPVRVGVALMLATAMVPVLQTFTDDIAQWINRFL